MRVRQRSFAYLVMELVLSFKMDNSIQSRLYLVQKVERVSFLVGYWRVVKGSDDGIRTNVSRHHKIRNAGP